MGTEGAKNHTANLEVSGQPSLPPEPQSPLVLFLYWNLTSDSYSDNDSHTATHSLYYVYLQAQVSIKTKIPVSTVHLALKQPFKDTHHWARFLSKKVK